MVNKTSNLVNDKPKWNPNPTGKGGFQERPQDINREGNWEPRNTFKYQMNRFKNMTIKELEDWNKEMTKEVRTVAEDLAFTAVVKAREKLEYFRELSNRTEGMPKQTTDITSGGETLTGLIQINEHD